MGAVQSDISKNVQDVVANAVTNSIIKNTSECTLQNINTSTIKFGRVEGDFNLNQVDLSQSVIINSTCLQTSTNDSKILQDIQNDLQQKFGNTSGLAVLSVSVKDNSIKLAQDITSNINLENIKKCLLNNLTETSIGADYVGGSVNISNLTITQVTNLVSKCLQSDKNTVDSTTKAKASLDQTAQTTNQLIIYAIIGFVVFIVFLFLIFFILKSSGGKKIAKAPIPQYVPPIPPPAPPQPAPLYQQPMIPAAQYQQAQPQLTAEMVAQLRNKLFPPSPPTSLRRNNAVNRQPEYFDAVEPNLQRADTIRASDFR